MMVGVTILRDDGKVLGKAREGDTKEQALERAGVIVEYSQWSAVQLNDKDGIGLLAGERVKSENGPFTYIYSRATSDPLPYENQREHDVPEQQYRGDNEEDSRVIAGGRQRTEEPERRLRQTNHVNRNNPKGEQPQPMQNVDRGGGKRQKLDLRNLDQSPLEEDDERTPNDFSRNIPRVSHQDSQDESKNEGARPCAAPEPPMNILSAAVPDGPVSSSTAERKPLSERVCIDEVEDATEDHCREHCPIYGFTERISVKSVENNKLLMNKEHCPHCLCYVCGIHAEECQQWEIHMHAYEDPSGEWKHYRDMNAMNCRNNGSKAVRWS